MKNFLLGILVTSTLMGAVPEEWALKNIPFRGRALPAEWNQGSSATAALYTGRGTWDVGVEHLKLFLKEKGISYFSVSPEDILGDILITKNPDFLIIPGGSSWMYLPDLKEEGAGKIKAFVSSGHGYIGICAGAFYATSKRHGGQATGPYGIGLLEGTAYDGTALETSPFIEGMMNFDFEPLAWMQGLQKRFRIVLLGGPSFQYSAEEERKKKIQVISRFQEVNEPAMILFQYGKGKVYLTGPHLEVEENLLDWGDDYYDPESDWPILQRVVNQLLK